MKTQNIISITLLFILSLTIFSCQKEIVENEPEAFYDKGERLKLNDYLLVLDNSELTHNGGISGVWYDAEEQVLLLDTITVEAEIDTSNVLLIEMEDSVLLLRVNNVEKEGGQYTISTGNGYIHDVFHNAGLSFDFDPQYSNEKLKSVGLSNLKNATISEELTDDDNAIHPSEIRMTVGNTEQVVFSVKKNIPLSVTKSSTNNDGKVGFEHQFNTNMTIVEVGPLKLELEDLGFSWYSDLKADYSSSTKYHSHTAHFLGYSKTIKTAYEKDVDLTITAEDMDIEAWFDIAAVVDGTLPLVNETDPLLLPVQMTFEFLVSAVPVIIRVEFALDLGVNISVEGALKASTGYTLKYNVPKLMVGAHGWVKEPNVWDWGLNAKYDFEEGSIVEHKMHPLELEAMATLKQTYTLKPTMGFSIYGAAGPEINLAIGTECDFSVGGGASIDLTGNKAPEAYIGWGSKLSTKVGAGGGVWIDCFGVINKHLDIPTLSLLPSIPIWHTPDDMKEKSNLGDTKVGVGKEVEVEVIDSWTLPAPLMFVEWVSDGGGHWKDPITLTTLGTSKNTWIPTDEGTFKPYCYVKNGELKEKGRVTFETTTTAQ